MEQDAGLGVATKPIDIGWGGEPDAPIDEQRAVFEIVRLKALLAILLEIVRHHPADDTRKKGRKNIKPLEQFRIEAALKALVGISPRHGPATQMEAVAQRAAALYYSSFFGLSARRSERDILIKANWPEGQPKALSSQDVDNRIKDLKKYFRRNKDRLMIEYALAESREFEFGRESTEAIISELKALGLASRAAG